MYVPTPFNAFKRRTIHFYYQMLQLSVAWIHITTLDIVEKLLQALAVGVIYFRATNDWFLDNL